MARKIQFPPGVCRSSQSEDRRRKVSSPKFGPIDKVIQGEPCGYDVVIDRISQDVPFYRAWLKNAALTGTAVVNNPFWWSADEKFFNNALATKIGVAVPKNRALAFASASARHERRTRFGTWPIRSIGRLFSPTSAGRHSSNPSPAAAGKMSIASTIREEFFRAYSETGQLVMMLQEEVKFEMYFRCYSIDQRNVRIMPYEPRHPYHLRYQTEWQAPKEILQKVEQGVLQLNRYLGYDLNTVEFADARRHPGGDRFLQSRRPTRKSRRWARRISNGWWKRFRRWRFAKHASINPDEIT